MNSVCDLLNINYPIVLGGMGNISSPRLTQAVSEAGGLGTIGCGTMSLEEVEKKIIATKEMTHNPFAVNIAMAVAPDVEQMIQLVIDQQVPVVSLSAGNPAPYIPRLQEHGIKVMALVASVKHAKKAEEAGADLLVAEGYEAAGINSNLELTTFTLIPQIVRHVNIPVLAAGGVGDGKGLAAALMLGASGVQMGTRFIVTEEAPFHDHYKERVLEANGTGTTIVGRTVGQVRRILNTSYAKKLKHLEKSGITLDDYRHLTSEKLHSKGALDGDLDNGFLNSGQVTGLIDDIPTVQELIEGMIEEAAEQMEQSRSLLKVENDQLKY
ncbi:NAD(P)H-dependent flavin oxidoreductase [Alkalibacillus silvisoli]|uniref:Probable nitronate monooxygenase n=1 Tax=Alkalibacillus silvisoli TaxID=392823 RepID=A0ABN1A290_9BACI